MKFGMLGISSYTYTWAVGVPGQMPEKPLSALDLLERAASLGVHLLQVADNIPLHRISPSDLDTFAALAEQLGIQIEVGTRGIKPGHLGEYLELARRLKSPVLRIVVDSEDHHPTPDEVVELLRSQISHFEKAGIILAIENHDRFKVRTLVDIIERVGSLQLGICLDTVNSFGALEGMEDVVHVLAPYTVNLHVKDFTIRRVSHKMGFIVEGKPAGKGMLNLPWILEELGKYNHKPNAILELWTPPSGTLTETLAREAQWAEESIAYLSHYITNDAR